MSLAEQLQSSTESISALKAILWCFYPMVIAVVLELLMRNFDDDDDQDGGKLIPVAQVIQ